jgi:pimeloyl-ACP methyl ester carboxylesterase
MNADTITWEQLLDPAADQDIVPNERPDFLLAPGFQAVTAWWLAVLSHLSYRSAAQGGQAMALSLGLEERFFCQVGAAQCSLYLSTDVFLSASPVAILVFKGTDSLRQWISNVDTLPIAWDPNGYVHGGFAKALAGIWDELGPRLQALDVPLFITGHSLGGALATLATARLDRHLPAGTYTFGSPRVGNEDFVRECLGGTPLYRLVNHHDFVCSLPRPVAISARFRYAHAGELILFDETGEHIQPTDTNPASDPSFRKLLKDAFETKRTRPPRALADHAVQLYVDRLRRLLP